MLVSGIHGDGIARWKGAFQSVVQFTLERCIGPGLPDRLQLYSARQALGVAPLRKARPRRQQCCG
ncbi:MAG TPA: hypothetical protein VJT77_11230, partial [Burkholderiales bacterium]|nr:hypothetical protein [Burkholderiales bacterium]